MEAVKEVEEELPGTVTDARTVKTGTLLDSFTTVPPEGAALERATVQVVLALAVKVVAVHWTDERATGAIKEREAVLETPVREAVMVAL